MIVSRQELDENHRATIQVFKAVETLKEEVTAREAQLQQLALTELTGDESNGSIE